MSRSPSERRERWRREDEAPRLSQKAPALLQLRLELSESFQGRKVLDSNRVVHIVVASAAARFEVPCSDVRCKDGGHDLTHDVLQNLQQRKQSFVGQDTCNGYVGDRPCDRVLQFVTHARFNTTSP